MKNRFDRVGIRGDHDSRLCGAWHSRVGTGLGRRAALLRREWPKSHWPACSTWASSSRLKGRPPRPASTTRRCTLLVKLQLTKAGIEVLADTEVGGHNEGAAPMLVAYIAVVPSTRIPGAKWKAASIPPAFSFGKTCCSSAIAVA